MIKTIVLRSIIKLVSILFLFELIPIDSFLYLKIWMMIHYLQYRLIIFQIIHWIKKLINHVNILKSFLSIDQYFVYDIVNSPSNNSTISSASDKIILPPIPDGIYSYSIFSYFIVWISFVFLRCIRMFMEQFWMSSSAMYINCRRK